MSDFGFSVTDPRKKCRKSSFFFEKMMLPSKVLEFSGDRFDSRTARNREFRLFPKMSVHTYGPGYHANNALEVSMVAIANMLTEGIPC